jgi:hypothetical protein
MRALLLITLAGTLGCGVLDGLLTSSSDVVEGFDCSPGQGCGDSFDCGVAGECGNLVCSFDFSCEDPDVAYNGCAAAEGLGPGFRSDEGDLLLYDLLFEGGGADGCFDFIVNLDDNAEDLDYDQIAVGAGMEIRAVGGGPTIENIFGDEVEQGAGFLSFSVCGEAESFAFLVADGTRRSNTVCALRNFAPVSLGGAVDVGVGEVVGD